MQKQTLILLITDLFYNGKHFSFLYYIYIYILDFQYRKIDCYVPANEGCGHRNILTANTGFYCFYGMVQNVKL